MKKVRWGNWFLAIVGIVVVVLLLAWLIPMWVRNAKAAPSLASVTIVRQTVVVRETVVVDRFVTTTPAAPSATPTLAPSATNSPTSVPTGTSSIVSTVSVTSTNSVSGTASSSDLVHPEFFEGQSSGKEYRASYDIGVKEGQVGIAFGYSIEWQGRVLGYPTDKCGLVILLPGWYERFSLTDGRYEVYDLPSTNQEFWIKDLARQRMEEQQNHYGCSGKKDVEVWKSGVPAVVWSIVAPPSVVIAPTATMTAAVIVEPTASQSNPTVTPTATQQEERTRVTSGKDGTINFVKGDEVYGFEIVLDSGIDSDKKIVDPDKMCTGGCYLPSAPESGTVKDGVVFPWEGEVPNGTSPWTPPS